MAIVIDALSIVENKKRLPCEAFFVDTNIIIDSKDLFGRSLDSAFVAQTNFEVNQTLHYLKSSHHTSYSTLSVAVEYYKHLQVGYYLTQTGEKYFKTAEFKKKREGDIAFFTGWDLHLKSFKKLFTKNYPIHSMHELPSSILATFEGSRVDFGDHLLFTYVMKCEKNQRCIFTNDGDFYSYNEDFLLLTTNKNIIGKAKTNGNIVD